jgi:hypothetical protein
VFVDDLRDLYEHRELIGEMFDESELDELYLVIQKVRKQLEEKYRVEFDKQK